MKRRVSLMLALSVSFAAGLIVGEAKRRPRLPAVEVAQSADAPFRDGLYQAKLDTEEGRKSHPAIGRWMAPGRVATVPGGADYELSSRWRDVPGGKCDTGRIQTFLPGRLHERLSARVLHPSETSGRKDRPVRTLFAVAFKRVRTNAAEPHPSITPAQNPGNRLRD